MKIAIVGAGFLGLACTWYLGEHIGDAEVWLFDAKGIGAGASGMAAGLLHPFAGRKATLNWKADEAFPEALSLLEIAGNEVFRKTGIFRPAVTIEQREYFSET